MLQQPLAITRMSWEYQDRLLLEINKFSLPEIEPARKCTAEYDHRCLFTRVVCTSRALFTMPLNSIDVQIVVANQYVQHMFREDGWALASFARP